MSRNVMFFSLWKLNTFKCTMKNSQVSQSRLLPHLIIYVPELQMFE